MEEDVSTAALNTTTEDHGTIAAVTFGTALYHIAESEEVSSLVTDLPEVCRGDMRMREVSEQRFIGAAIVNLRSFVLFIYIFYAVILDKYQEQPHSLDSSLGRAVYL